MREIVRSAQFKRDVKLAEKRGKDMAKLRELILLELPEKRIDLRQRYQCQDTTDCRMAVIGATHGVAYGVFALPRRTSGLGDLPKEHARRRPKS